MSNNSLNIHWNPTVKTRSCFKNLWQFPRKIFWKHLQGTMFYKSDRLNFFESKENTYCGCICWVNPTGGFCLIVNAIWATGPALGGTCTFWEKVCWAACWGMGHGGTAGLRPPGEDVSCTPVSSQEFPFVPGLHTQSWGRRHIPPFWHGGAQFAEERHFKKYLWNKAGRKMQTLPTLKKGINC